MDYEKKYKEALKRVRRLHDRMLVLSSTDALVASAELEFIFPELKGSEDERIRNGLIAHIQGHLNTQDDFTRRQETGPFSSEEVKFFMDALAWLEKQKEQKPEWSESDTLMCNAALELLHSHPNLMASHGINKSSVIRWLQSFRPQKQGFIDDICSKAGIAIPYLDGNQWCILKGDNIQAGVVGFGGTKEDAIANFIKDVSIPQQWSEEDEKMLKEVLDRVTYAFYEQGNEGEIEDDPVFLWVHKLRPSWKPSEEQMSKLKEVIYGLCTCGNGPVLKSLYEDLKKLM